MDRSSRVPQDSAKSISKRRRVLSLKSIPSRFLARWRKWKSEVLQHLLALPLMVALLVTIVGILLQRIFEVPYVVTLVLATGSATLAMIGSKCGFSLWMLRCTAGATLALVAAALYQLEHDARPVDTLNQHASLQWKPIVVEGTVREALRYRPQLARQAAPSFASSNTDESTATQTSITEAETLWTTLVSLEVTQILNGNEAHSTYGFATVAVDGMLEQYLPGDRVRVAGRIILIGPARNPGEPDYQEWMQRRGEWVRLRAESADALEHVGCDYVRFGMKRWLAYLGRAGRQQLAVHLPEPQCSLAAALLLGQREQVGNETNEKLLATGTIHLLSISGLHVEMIAISLLMLAVICRVPRSVTLWGTGGLILIYAMVTGSNPPVVRATVLVLGVLSGRWVGRPASVFNMLGLAGLGLLLYQPSLLFDLGTELSFLAVFCLVLLSRSDSQLKMQEDQALASGPMGQAEGKNTTEKKNWWQGVLWPWLKSMVSMNLGVWLATTPLVLYHFNIFSPIALLLNILLWLPVLVAMLSGLALMLLGWVPGLGDGVGLICYWSIVSVQSIVDWGYGVRGGHVWLPEPSWSWLVVAYGLVGLSFLLLLHSKRGRVAAVVLLSAWIVLASFDGWFGPAGVWGESKLVQSLRPQKLGHLRIQILDVGHGSAVIIRLPDGTAWLYDAGRLGDQQQVYKTVSQALWQLRVARLNGMILSHADADHYSGMKGVLWRFGVDQFAAGPRQWEHDSPVIQDIFQLLKYRDIKLVEWSRGEEVQLGDVRLSVVHPPQDQRVGSDNARSVCVLLEYAGRKILLPGDLESPGMEQVEMLPRPNCDVVMAPHHGSLSGNPRSFLDWCGAPWVLISGSERADSEPVKSVYGAAGREVYLTVREHALEVAVDARGSMQLSRWKDDAWEQIRERSASE